MQKFEHSDVIKEYEIPVLFDKVTGITTDDRGKSILTYEKKSIKIAYFQVLPNELNEKNGFESGDIKIFCRTDQENILSENDKVPAFGNNYIIKNEIPLAYTDYKVLLARRVVDNK